MRSSEQYAQATQVKYGKEAALVEVHLPTSHYADEFLGLKCAPDLLATGFFPNFKEVTESFAAFRAVRKHLMPHGFGFGDPQVLLVSVGDGRWPRTAATFAFRTRWSCVAVDPILKQEAEGRVERLKVFTERAEKMHYGPDGWGSIRAAVVVVAVHSHADLTAAVRPVWKAAERLGVVAIPCCVEQELDLPGMALVADYLDWGIWSPDRRVKVWVGGRVAGE